MKKNGWWMVCRWVGVGLVGCWLTACAGLEKMVDRGLEPMLVQLAPDSEAYRFDFVFDDSADGGDQVYGAGFVVVSQGDKELQAIPHAFELPRDHLDGRQWLKFWDANGDGWQDFAVVRLLAPESQMPVSVLYQYEPQTRTFVVVEPLSHLGELMPAGRGCLRLRFAVEAGHTAQETHCYSAQAARWVRQLGQGTGWAQAPADRACQGPTPELLGCRKSRLEADKEMQDVVREYRSAQRQLLQQNQSRDYVQAFSRNLAISHATWLRYRNARCALFVREQALPAALFNSAIEACRYDLSRSQIQQYKVQLARLSSQKE